MSSTKKEERPDSAVPSKKETMRDYEATDVVIMAVDNSAHSEQAFDHYIKKVHRDDNELMMVHSFELPYLHRGLSIAGYEIVHDTVKDYMNIVEEHRKETLRLKEKYDQKLKDMKIKHSFRLLETRHHVGPTLCSLAETERAKLIVLGSRGVGYIRETILGSTSSYVVHHANTPVMVIKREQDLYTRLFDPKQGDQPRMKWYY